MYSIFFFSRNGSQDGYSSETNHGVALKPDLSGIEGTPVKPMEATREWERVNWAWNRCNEGPAVIKHRGRYYMTYPANHTGFAGCGVGYATAERPLGPWTKAAEKPILATSPEVKVSSPGHNSPVHSPEEGFGPGSEHRPDLL